MSKVLLATDVGVRGGVDSYVIELAKYARSVGWEVEILLEQTTNCSIGKSLGALGFTIHKGRLYHRKYSMEEIRLNSEKILDTVTPDIVHVSCGIPWSCITLRLAIIAKRIPLVITEHYVPEDVTYDPIQTEHIREIYRSSWQSIFVNTESRNILCAALNLATENTTVIFNAIDVKQIQRKSSDAAERKQRLKKRMASGHFKIMSSARYSHQKGLDILLEALPLLDLSDIPFTVNLFGDGPDKLKLEKLCHSLGLQDKVNFCSWSDDIYKELSEHDLFILPSRSEGMPFALLEALAVGIPVIASTVPGHLEVLNNGEFGELFPIDDPTVLAQRIENWCQNPLPSLTRAQNALSWMAHHHDLQTNMKHTVDVWHEGLKQISILGKLNL